MLVEGMLFNGVVFSVEFDATALEPDEFGDDFGSTDDSVLDISRVLLGLGPFCVAGGGGIRPWLDCMLDGARGLDTAMSSGEVELDGAGAFRLMTFVAGN